MKMKRRTSRVVVLGLAAAMCSFVVATPAFAGNTDNSNLSLNLYASSGYTDGSGWRDKNDTSPTFVWIKQLTQPCNLYVDGSNDGGASRASCTVNGKAPLYKLGSFVINQNVNEWGYRQAEVTGWSPNGDCYVGGEWSPDSYGSYPSLNA